MQGRPNSTDRSKNSPLQVDLGSVPVRPLFSGRLVWLVSIFGIGMALAVAIATTAALYAGRSEAIKGAEAITRNLARTLTDSVERSINSIDITLASVGDLAREHGLDAGQMDLGGAVAQRMAFIPYLRQILVVRADGKVLFDSARIVTGQSLDISGLVLDHTKMPRPLVIGIPIDGRFIGGPARAAGQRVIPISRQIQAADGRLMGLVIAAANPEYFISNFQSIESEAGAHVHLWRFDGPLLAGGGGVDDAHQFSRSESTAIRDHLTVSENGTFNKAADDGLDWIISYRTTLSWPLVVSVGLPVDMALGNWRRSADMIGGPVAVVIVIIFALTGAMVAMLRRRGRDEARLRLSDMVLSNVSNGVTIAEVGDHDLPLIYVNPAFERITGFVASQALGRNARFLHEFDPAQDGLDVIREALAEGVPASVILRNQRADGAEFWNNLSLSPVRGQDGAITHWVGVQHDITLQEEARVALAKAYDDVAHYSEDLERFSFVLAHHLQEPARQMRLQAQVLLQRLGEESDPGIRQPASLVIEASARLVDLLRDVQAYLAVERQPLVGGIASSETAFLAAINRFVDPAQGIEAKLEKALLPRVGIAQKRLDDLFEILIENAVRFRHPDRQLQIRVGAEFRGERWLFRVADNGIGIDPDYHERVFVALERLHSQTDYSGTGIGLAIARKIIE
ncbi:MAG: PAS domain-containing protein, partial [Magnetospirillum sp.]|nr:PAS domain-containing protein [Magnetospirillum sp.]